MNNNLLDNDTLKKLHYFNYPALITAYRQLIDIINQEIASLSNKKITSNENWQEIKSDLSSFIKMQAKILANHPEISNDIPTHDKEELKTLAQKMLDLTDEYRKNLNSKIYANETIIRITTEALKKEMSLNENYNEKGKIINPTKTRSNPALAFSKIV
jgi:chromosome segregation ATPase